jgi:ATP-dependent RNA helicase RhlB
LPHTRTYPEQFAFCFDNEWRFKQMAESHLTDLSFSSLHLPESLQKGLADANFERCTPIQAQTLPQALAGMDIAGQAQTGTGKTIAFLVALYAKLL